MVHYVNSTVPLESITLGFKFATATPVGDLFPLNHKVNISGDQFRFINLLVSSPKHVVLNVCCESSVVNYLLYSGY